MNCNVVCCLESILQQIISSMLLLYFHYFSFFVLQIAYQFFYMHMFLPLSLLFIFVLCCICLNSVLDRLNCISSLVTERSLVFAVKILHSQMLIGTHGVVRHFWYSIVSYIFLLTWNGNELFT